MNTSTEHQNKPLAAIILAAGKGSRMNSDLPKVVHQVAGKPMVRWVVDAVRGAGADRVILVVGHGANIVKEKLSESGCEYVIQEPQLGTGHAVQVCKETLKDFDGNILILGGDGPLLRSSTINEMVSLQQKTNSSATLATSVIPDPTGYGRILRDDQNKFSAIIEHKNATEEQLKIHEIYPSYAVFKSDILWETLDQLKPNTLTNEYYLTEIPGMLVRSGHNVEIVNSVAPEDILSINTAEQLTEVEEVLLARHHKEVEPTA
ncbi:MAG: NTP transferase domain-containing protein [Phycisphaerales bacterium]|jgi:UDP-N-acetylglucosamine diphosphorylase/glucosamine-1-phosphate N-acetyltransferase|nr:NTP transferase domain-containing protein [Phycisphaerales bacterium]